MSDDSIAPAEFPLLERDPRFRCLVGVCLGSDTCPSVVPGIGVAKLNAITEKAKCDGYYC